MLRWQSEPNLLVIERKCNIALTLDVTIGREDLTKQTWTQPKSKSTDEEGLCVSRQERREGYRVQRGRRVLNPQTMVTRL